MLLGGTDMNAFYRSELPRLGGLLHSRTTSIPGALIAHSPPRLPQRPSPLSPASVWEGPACTQPGDRHGTDFPGRSTTLVERVMKQSEENSQNLQLCGNHQEKNTTLRSKWSPGRRGGRGTLDELMRGAAVSRAAPHPGIVMPGKTFLRGWTATQQHAQLPSCPCQRLFMEEEHPAISSAHRVARLHTQHDDGAAWPARPNWSASPLMYKLTSLHTTGAGHQDPSGRGCQTQDQMPAAREWGRSTTNAFPDDRWDPGIETASALIRSAGSADEGLSHWHPRRAAPSAAKMLPALISQCVHPHWEKAGPGKPRPQAASPRLRAPGLWEPVNHHHHQAWPTSSPWGAACAWRRKRADQHAKLNSALYCGAWEATTPRLARPAKASRLRPAETPRPQL